MGFTPSRFEHIFCANFEPMPRNILHLVLVIFSILDLASHGGSDETGTVMYMTLAAGCRVGGIGCHEFGPLILH
jgi:hypothetical protein